MVWEKVKEKVRRGDRKCTRTHSLRGRGSYGGGFLLYLGVPLLDDRSVLLNCLSGGEYVRTVKETSLFAVSSADMAEDIF